MPEMRFERTAQRAARAVYGSIIALAVIIALEDTSASALEVVAASIGAVVAAMLAEGYAEYVAQVIRQRRYATRTELVQNFQDIGAGALAAMIPVAPFVLAELGLIELQTAYDVAPWLGVAVIGAYSLLANRLDGLGAVQTWLLTAAGMLVGVSLIAIKAATH